MEKNKSALRHGTIVNGIYSIDSVYNSTDTYIEYRAIDLNSKEEVKIRELYIAGVCNRTIEQSNEILIADESVFAEQIEQFKLSSEAIMKTNKGIVKDFFNLNNTVYFVIIETKDDNKKSNYFLQIAVICVELILIVVVFFIGASVLGNDRNKSIANKKHIEDYGDNVKEDNVNNSEKSQLFEDEEANNENTDGYFIKADGTKAKNEWIENCFYKEDGRMAKNEWIGGYYIKDDGKKAISEWVGPYYFKADGRIANSEWIDEYYIKDDGTKAVSEWVGDCYLGSDGRMVKNKWIDGYYIKDDGKKAISEWVGDCYFKADGRIANDEWVDGDKYYIGKDGHMVPGKQK